MLIFNITKVNAQYPFTISGNIQDTLKQPIIGANIILLSGKDSLYTSSNSKGNYTLPKIMNNEFTIKVSIIGYNTFSKKYIIGQATLDTIFLPPIELVPKSSMLKEIVIKGKFQPIIIKDDTIEYRIDQIKLKEDAVVEDLLKRLPGLSIDLNGNIFFMGQAITKLQINGQEYSVDNIKTLTKLLPSNMLDGVQVFEDYGKLAKITGRKNAAPIYSINIKTKSSIKKSKLLQTSLGLGTENRYELSANGGFGTPNNRFFIAGGTQNIGSLNGTQIVKNGIANYLTTINKLTLRSILSWENTTNKLEASSISTIITSNGILILDNKNTTEKKSNNNSLNLSGDYESKNKDILSFYLKGSLLNANDNSKTQSDQSGIQILKQTINNSTNENSPSLEGNILFAHPLNKKGRVLTTSIAMSYMKNQTITTNYNSSLYYKTDTVSIDSIYNQIISKKNNHFTAAYVISYIEPINSKTNMELRYNLNTVRDNNLIKTLQIDSNKVQIIIDSLSSQYLYNTQNHQLNLNLWHQGKSFEITVGSNANFYNINTNNKLGPNNRNSGYIFSPMTRIDIKSGKYNRGIISYNTDIILPSYQQIQLIKDQTNIQFPIFGNPNLKASTSNNIKIEYRHIKNSMYSIQLKSQIKKNAIVTNTILVNDTLGTIVQETHFLNTNGIYNLELGYGWSKQYGDNKFQISIDGNNSYSNNITFLQDQKKTVKNYHSDHSIKGSAFYDWLELQAQIGYIFNQNTYFLEQRSTSNYSTIGLSLNGKFLFLKTWSVFFQIEKQLNYSTNADNLANPIILNMEINKTLLKSKLLLKMKGINLTNQASSVSQTITINSITQNKTNLIGKFILFSITYNFRKITTGN